MRLLGVKYCLSRFRSIPLISAVILLSLMVEEITCRHNHHRRHTSTTNNGFLDANGNPIFGQRIRKIPTPTGQATASAVATVTNIKNDKNKDDGHHHQPQHQNRHNHFNLFNNNEDDHQSSESEQILTVVENPNSTMTTISKMTTTPATTTTTTTSTTIRPEEAINEEISSSSSLMKINRNKNEQRTMMIPKTASRFDFERREHLNYYSSNSANIDQQQPKHKHHDNSTNSVIIQNDHNNANNNGRNRNIKILKEEKLSNIFLKRSGSFPLLSPSPILSNHHHDNINNNNNNNDNSNKELHHHNQQQDQSTSESIHLNRYVVANDGDGGADGAGTGPYTTSIAESETEVSPSYERKFIRQPVLVEKMLAMSDELPPLTAALPMHEYLMHGHHAHHHHPHHQNRHHEDEVSALIHSGPIHHRHHSEHHMMPTPSPLVHTTSVIENPLISTTSHVPEPSPVPHYIETIAPNLYQEHKEIRQTSPVDHHFQVHRHQPLISNMDPPPQGALAGLVEHLEHPMQPARSPPTIVEAHTAPSPPPQEPIHPRTVIEMEPHIQVHHHTPMIELEHHYDSHITQPIPFHGGGGGGDDHHHNVGIDLEHLDHIPGIPGKPWKDYPLYSEIPKTSFKCNGSYGYFADVEAGCQVWHYCQPDGRHDSFLCSNGTLFNQKTRVCDWWHNVDCKRSIQDYGVNTDLYKEEYKEYHDIL